MSRPDDQTGSGVDEPFLDAEAWLAARGVERRMLVDLTEQGGDDENGPADAAGEVTPAEGAHGEADGRPDISSAEARRLADPAAGGHALHDPDQVRAAPTPTVAATPSTAVPLDQAVSAAVATVRRITNGSPSSEGRVRRKLRERDLPDVVVDQALARARQERLVDDDALAAAMVAEWRAKGHAPRRLRDDLRSREFDDDVVQRATAVAEGDDPGAAAFDLAQDRASQLTHVEPEKAMRRTAAYLARRGYGEGLARKAARDAVHHSREDARTAGR